MMPEYPIFELYQSCYGLKSCNSVLKGTKSKIIKNVMVLLFLRMTLNELTHYANILIILWSFTLVLHVPFTNYW